MTFPVTPLGKLPSAASSTDKKILGPKITELIDAVNGLHLRLDALENPAPAPIPVPIPTPEPIPEPTPPPAPTDPQSIVLSLLGPTKSVADTAALGFASYDAKFDELMAIIDVGPAETWGDNYYDRGKLYYARYARTGDPKWLDRANAITLMYRDEYLVPNVFKAAPHWVFVKGLETHYRLTGDPVSQQAAAGMFAQTLVSHTLPGADGKAELERLDMMHMENRIQARCLHAALSAYRVGATFVRPDGYGGEYSPATWPTRLRDMLNRVLGTQSADGSWQWDYLCGGQLNFMIGILNDVLVEYYRDFEADPRIPVAVAKANDYLWSTQWQAADQAFQYMNVACAPNPQGQNIGGTGVAGDLNGLFIASFGWLRAQTGDAKWQTRGDEILAGLVRWAFSGSKQFNQAYAESYRYFGWR